MNNNLKVKHISLLYFDTFEIFDLIPTKDILDNHDLFYNENEISVSKILNIKELDVSDLYRFYTTLKYFRDINDFRDDFSSFKNTNAGFIDNFTDEDFELYRSFPFSDSIYRPRLELFAYLLKNDSFSIENNLLIINNILPRPQLDEYDLLDVSIPIISSDSVLSRLGSDFSIVILYISKIRIGSKYTGDMLKCIGATHFQDTKNFLKEHESEKFLDKQRALLNEYKKEENERELEKLDSIREFEIDLEQKWEEDYEKKWVMDDMTQDSDLTDYDSDGNYLYEDNSNPTNSAYFNKDDLDFLNNN